MIDHLIGEFISPNLSKTKSNMKIWGVEGSGVTELKLRKMTFSGSCGYHNINDGHRNVIFLLTFSISFSFLSRKPL